TGEDKFLPPSYRPDISIEEDLIEEIGRFRGYNETDEKLPGEMPHRADIGEVMALSGSVRNILISRGYTEVVTYSFLPEDFAQKLRLPEDDVRSKILTLANPISRSQMAMRTTLLPGLLSAVRNSLSSGFKDSIRIFESGRVFVNNCEPEHVAGLIFNGSDTRSIYNDRSEDFYDVKSDVETLIMSRGYNPVFKAGSEPFTHSGQSAKIYVDDQEIGFVARLKPVIEQELEIEKVYIFEIDLTGLMTSRKPEFKPSSQFPAVNRDIAILVSRDRSSDDVMSDIYSSVKDLTLEKLRLFDIYEGSGIPEGFRSLAYTLSYRSDEKTLTDSEVDGVHNEVRENLKRKGYIIR
ncbi:MAG: phenylalanine--tRNA ligase subunit beta, partial [Synergistaceae bacterium]|nr:phenylalanine--tRNA ligase subunit beta [Synergistaceae bacterium]